MIGDYIYKNNKNEELKELKLAYEAQRQNFQMMYLDTPFEAIWDDHDYGMNDTGANFLHQ